METEHRPSLTWNRSAIPIGALMFLVAEVATFGAFMNPRIPWILVTVWFFVAFVVQFWGSRSDRIVAIVALVVMAVAMYLLFTLGT